MMSSRLIMACFQVFYKLPMGIPLIFSFILLTKCTTKDKRLPESKKKHCLTGQQDGGYEKIFAVFKDEEYHKGTGRVTV